MKKLFSLVLLPLLTGCMTASVVDTSRWMVNYTAAFEPAPKPQFGIARLVQVTIRAPYGSEQIVVLRADGSVAFDPYNTFAASPSQLLRGVSLDAMVASGLFSAVLPAGSVAASAVSVEVLVLRLALDCRDAAARTAVADVLVRVVDSKGAIVAVARATGKTDATGSDFGQSFSQAVSTAVGQAFDDLKK